uniref:Uncharacterized protein n=1 Tax=Solanum tuberosum TaxID=4113 RepID=M1DNZ3_SOLTU
MDHPPLKMMLLRDNILSFKKLEGRSGKIVEKCRLASKGSSRHIAEVVSDPTQTAVGLKTILHWSL